MDEKNTVKLYALVNDEGKFWFNGGNAVHHLQEAKLWQKPGPAKTRITQTAKYEGIIYSLVEITGTISNIIPQTERVTKVLKKQVKDKMALEFRNIHNAEEAQ